MMSIERPIVPWSGENPRWRWEALKLQAGGQFKPCFGLSWDVSGVSWPVPWGLKQFHKSGQAHLGYVPLLPALFIVPDGHQQANVQDSAGAGQTLLRYVRLRVCVIPDHVHLLLGEPQHRTLADALKSLSRCVTAIID
ncbi:MAG TPA: hypothetical protein VGM27_15220 [Acidobacteriaceae bacterium]